jgi:hypothetical protein
MTTLRVVRPARVRTPIQVATTAVGAVFLALGLLGFVPGIVSDYDRSVLHNLFHVAFGVAGLGLARTHLAGAFLLCGGAVHLVLWFYGVVTHGSDASVVPLNDADNWVHLGIAAVMITLGLALEPRPRSPARNDETRRRRSPGRSL